MSFSKMIAVSAVTLASGALAGSLATCSSSLPFSCETTSTVTDTCCYNSPGGVLLQTQFWETHPSDGPTDSWTIHGLWSDNCDGTYQENCDSSRDYTSITAILTAQGRTDLLSYMDTYWPDYKGDNERFWEHEWYTHGTCINTIDPSCYTDYTPQEEVGDFFQKVTDLFQGLNTYQALANAGITPSTSKTYTLSAIQTALKAITGYAPYVGCSSKELNQVYYYYHVQGNAIDGTYSPIAAFESTNCPSTGIKYVPKSS